MTSFECDWALAVAAAAAATRWSRYVAKPFEMAPEPISAKETLQ